MPRKIPRTGSIDVVRRRVDYYMKNGLQHYPKVLARRDMVALINEGDKKDKVRIEKAKEATKI